MVSGSVALIGEIAGHQLLEPRVAVAVCASPDGVFRAVQSTVDTGFTGWITLPSQVIHEFGLLYQGWRNVKLADGRQRRVSLYLGFILWHGQILPRLIHQSDGNSLLGMGLLAGSKLTVESVAGGNVSIEEIYPN